jgi:hypothetical protein
MNIPFSVPLAAKGKKFLPPQKHTNDYNNINIQGALHNNPPQRGGLNRPPKFSP